MRAYSIAVWTVLGAAVFVSPNVALAKASKFNEVLSVGEKAPDFSAVPGIDEKKHGLGEYKDAKAVVVIFTCNHCPVAVAYEDRMVALQKEFKKQGVQFVAICSNSEDEDTLPKLKERAEEKKFNFPYLHDDGQKVGRKYGAAVTPHVFLLDRKRNIAYMGAIDDNMNAEKVAKHYLSDAIKAVLAGKQPETTETRQFGCGIQYTAAETGK
jgi:peroxiredoxin